MKPKYKITMKSKEGKTYKTYIGVDGKFAGGLIKKNKNKALRR